jgi:uncharacterized protein with NAD-binding domain and iron-sulfur cluster
MRERSIEARQLRRCLQVDFYNASTLLGLSDEQIVRRVQADYLGACMPGFRLLQVVDSSVLKFRGAVTAFSPGSNASLPTTSSSVPGVYFAGDWVRQVRVFSVVGAPALAVARGSC